MNEQDWLAQRFEEYRTRLWAVAYRMLGSRAEADDAVQEAWLRLTRSDASGVENMGGWLTTVVARVCLNMLHSRKSRREQPLDEQVPGPNPGDGIDPSNKRCWPTRSVSRSWSSTPWHPPSGSRSCCTTCSPCPSTRSPHRRAVSGRGTATASCARRRVQAAGATVPDAGPTRQRQIVVGDARGVPHSGRIPAPGEWCSAPVPEPDRPVRRRGAPRCGAGPQAGARDGAACLARPSVRVVAHGALVAGDDRRGLRRPVIAGRA